MNQKWGEVSWKILRGLDNESCRLQEEISETGKECTGREELKKKESKG